MLFLAISAYKYIANHSWVISELLIFFLAQDIIDRMLFNEKEFTTNDYIAIGLIILVGTIRAIRKYDQSRRII